MLSSFSPPGFLVALVSIPCEGFGAAVAVYGRIGFAPLSPPLSLLRGLYYQCATLFSSACARTFQNPLLQFGVNRATANVCRSTLNFLHVVWRFCATRARRGCRLWAIHAAGVVWPRRTSPRLRVGSSMCVAPGIRRFRGAALRGRQRRPVAFIGEQHRRDSLGSPHSPAVISAVEFSN